MRRVIAILFILLVASAARATVPTQLPLLVGAGDSITAGTTPGSISYLSEIIPNGASWQIRNAGIPGNTCSAMIGQGPTLDTNLIPGANNVLVVWCGTNDMGNVGDTVAATYANLVSYCQARQAAGWIVLVVQMLSRTGNNPTGGETMDADKTAYNALIDTGWPGFSNGEVVLPSQVTANGAYANTTNFLDGIHPTTLAVTNYITPNIQNSVNALKAGGIGQATVISPSTLFFGSSSSASTYNLPAFNTPRHVLVVVAVRTAVAAVSSVRDTAGDTFVGLTDFSSGPNGNFQFWYAKNSTGNAANVVTVNLATAGIFNAAFEWVVQGADTNSPFDAQTANSNAASAAANTDLPYPTTNFTNEIFLVAATSYGTDITFGAGTGLTLDSAGFPPGGGLSYCGSEHVTVAGLQTASTGNAFMFLTPNVEWGTAMASFKTGFSIGGGTTESGPSRDAGPSREF